MSMFRAALLALYISHLPLLIWMLPISEDITAITPRGETRSRNVSTTRIGLSAFVSINATKSLSATSIGVLSLAMQMPAFTKSVSNSLS